MDPITLLQPLLQPLLPHLLGLVSASVGLGNFYMNHMRLIKTWERASDSLQKISGTYANRHVAKNSEKLIKCLANGDLIVPYLKHRLMIRLMMALSGIAVLGGAISLDGPGQLSDLTPKFEYWDVLLIILQVLLGAFAGSRWFLHKEESDFLVRLAALHKMFYDLYVKPAILEFNYNMDDSKEFQDALKSLRDESAEIKSSITKKT